MNKFVGSRLCIQSRMWHLISLQKGGYWDLVWDSLNDPVFDGVDGTGRFVEQSE